MKSSLFAWALLATGAVALAQADTGNQVTASNGNPVVHGKDQFPAAEKACLEAVAKKTGVDRGKLKITDVSWAQAGVGVTVKVPGAEAPWSCLANEKGRVQGVSYTGDEGRL